MLNARCAIWLPSIGHGSHADMDVFDTSVKRFVSSSVRCSCFWMSYWNGTAKFQAHAYPHPWTPLAHWLAHWQAFGSWGSFGCGSRIWRFMRFLICSGGQGRAFSSSFTCTSALEVSSRFTYVSGRYLCVWMSATSWYTFLNRTTIPQILPDLAMQTRNPSYLLLRKTWKVVWHFWFASKEAETSVHQRGETVWNVYVEFLCFLFASKKRKSPAYTWGEFFVCRKRL